MPEGMRRSDPVPLPSAQEQRIDRALLGSVLLCPLAVGINTIVGYTVAHWVCDVDRKTTEYIVSTFDLCLCAAAAVLALWASRQLADVDDSFTELGRRRFMMKMGFGLSALAAIIVVAGCLAMFTMAACD